ncbi:KTSC domain-containing protein, partial [Escherichia coli]
MNHHPVKSSRIASVGYDESSHTLEIRFHQLATLQYQQVPARIFRDFLIVVSK